MSNSNNFQYSNFHGLTTNSMLNNNIYNINKSFSQNQQLIEKTDFKNSGNLMHNNISDNIFLERISEYQINIDSNDRKLSVYPNPFKFTVTFGGVGAHQLSNKISNKNQSVDDEQNFFEATAGPVIDRKFKNVKYIKIDYVMLPRVTKLTSCTGKYDFESCDGTSHHLSSYGYLILKIKELSTGRILGTNNLLSDDGFILYPNKLMGNDFVMWTPSNGSRIFNNSNLGNLERLSFCILTPTGKQLSFVDAYGKEIDLNLIDKQRRNKEHIISLSYIEDRLKCFISVLVGVVENEMNTGTKYEN